MEIEDQMFSFAFKSPSAFRHRDHTPLESDGEFDSKYRQRARPYVPADANEAALLSTVLATDTTAVMLPPAFTNGAAEANDTNARNNVCSIKSCP
jgi:hypothetical protein